MLDRYTEQHGVHTRTRYANEFKLDAIRKVEREGNRPLARIAAELGVFPQLLGRWVERKQRYEEIHKRSTWSQTSYECELSRIKRKLERVTSERNILKKAIPYFARVGKRGTNTSERKANRST